MYNRSAEASVLPVLPQMFADGEFCCPGIFRITIGNAEQN